MTSTKKGFTLVEMMVVLGLIAMIMAAMTSSVMGAQKRAQIAKAESEVKIISQAILAYENYKHELPSYPSPQGREADAASLDFLLGGDSAETGGRIPVLLMAQLKSNGKITDPWNRPYRIKIKPGTIPPPPGAMMETGFYYPNFYRLSPEERQ